MDPERTSDNFNSIFYINPVLITYPGAYPGENSDVFSLFTATHVDPPIRVHRPSQINASQNGADRFTRSSSTHSASQPTSQRTNLPTYLFACPPTNLLTYLRVYLPIHLATYLATT